MSFQSPSIQSELARVERANKRPGANSLSRAARWLLLPVIGLASFFAIWHFAGAFLARPALLPPPVEVGTTFVNLLGQKPFWLDILASLKRVFLGFSCAAVLGVPLGLLLAQSKVTRRIALPVLALLRPIPPIAWIPLAILWFGIGDAPSYFITALAAFFPIFVNTLAGGLAVEKRHIQAARSLGAGNSELLLHVTLPSALPQVWTGLKIGLGQSWMAVVTSELIASQTGLGCMIQTSRLNLETAEVLSGMLAIGALGALMAFGLSSIEHWILPWQSLGKQES